MRRLVPYPVLAGEIALDITEVRLDGVPLDYRMVAPSKRTVALHRAEREKWGEARLSVRLRPPVEELRNGDWREVLPQVIAFERRTNTRDVVVLKERDGDSWGGEITVFADRHLGRVQIGGQITATVGGVPGRIIGGVDAPWTVDLQATTPTRENSIKVTWADFSDEANPHLHDYRQDPWYVETTGQEPLIYLNRRVEGLEEILKHARAPEREVREAIASEIAKDTWVTLFNDALFAAEIDEDERAEWPGGWREGVLKKLLPGAFPDLSPREALQEAVARCRSGEGGGDLQNRIRRSATLQARQYRNIGALIRSTRRASEETR